jgi:hypothetical protein
MAKPKSQPRAEQRREAEVATQVVTEDGAAKAAPIEITVGVRIGRL